MFQKENWVRYDDRMSCLRTILIAFALSLATVAPATAKDLQRGFEAAQRGDFATALREWRPLAEQGDAKAQHNLGLMYSNGDGVPKDPAEAVRWFRLAAEQGFAPAQFSLGVSFDTARGVAKDDVEAVRWWRLAAEQGHASAQYNLGNMFEEGRGVPQDNSKAVHWFRLAAKQGRLLVAMTNLGLMYAEGKGVSKDLIRAYMWSSLAADQGDQGALENREVIAKLMTAEQIAEAQQLMRDCVARHLMLCW